MNEVRDKTAYLGQNMEHQDFFQSQEWRNFQKAFGRKTYLVEQDNFCASIIEHKLPIVGKYFYIPRGPVIENPKSEIRNPKQTQNSNDQILKGIGQLVNLAKKENVGWIRVEPGDSRLLEVIRSSWRVAKAPYYVQPKEIFVIDISKSEEQLLSEMKSKTRYNIRLAQKHGVKITGYSLLTIDYKKYLDIFLKLTKEMAARQGIVPHPDVYYEKMFATFPESMLKLYVAEYNGNIIAANLMLFYGNTATYLHGASSDADRNVMAPFLLHWQATQDAKERGCRWYDFGGISTKYEQNTNVRNANKWEGITKFKMGFSTVTEPIVFPGTYDIIVNQRQYALYKGLQKAKMIINKFKR